MSIFKRIVVGTDGSDTAAEAVRQAAEIAKMSGASLEVFCAAEPSPAWRSDAKRTAAPDDVSYEFGQREEANFALEAAARIAGEVGVEVRPHPMEGDPADAILDVAEQSKADLIVVGNKGMTGAKRYLLGSVPNKVSHHSPCSVFIARTT
ncbi:MAG: universal stress protein [Solirubrobacterales bacterium]